MTLENIKTINKDNLKKKVEKEQKRATRKIRFYHSFLTIVLLLCVFQISYSALLNISKIFIYRQYISKSLDLKNNAKIRNDELNKAVNDFNSTNRAESIARNNLKMAGDNEVLVIINEPVAKNTEPKTFKSKFARLFIENIASKFVKNSDTTYITH